VITEQTNSMSGVIHGQLVNANAEWIVLKVINVKI